MGEPFPVHPRIERRLGLLIVEWVWSSDTYAWDDSSKRPITGIKWHMSDVKCDDILSCDCGTSDKDSQMSSCDHPVQIRKIIE